MHACDNVKIRVQFMQIHIAISAIIIERCTQCLSQLDAGNNFDMHMHVGRPYVANTSNTHLISFMLGVCFI